MTSIPFSTPLISLTFCSFFLLKSPSTLPPPTCLLRAPRLPYKMIFPVVGWSNFPLCPIRTRSDHFNLYADSAPPIHSFPGSLSATPKRQKNAKILFGSFFCSDAPNVPGNSSWTKTSTPYNVLTPIMTWMTQLVPFPPFLPRALTPHRYDSPSSPLILKAI